jgi:hypothetical protein
MALRFETFDINFSNVRGTQTQSRTVPFNGTVQAAQVAVQGFLFDFVTGDNNLDRIQVKAKKVERAGNDVEAEVRVIVADRTRDDDYNATVNVLVIADVT